jgi:cyclohexyl-isocyanide hydratase
VKIAFIVFNGITWLDLIGLYDPISRLKHMGFLPELHWEFCSHTDYVGDQFGMQFVPTSFNESLKGFDVLAVPGGYGTRLLQNDANFLSWLQTASDIPLKVSVCTGSLLLGAAGFLKGKKATTHFSDYKSLEAYCREVSTDRIVDDQNVITAGAVSSSIDLGLYLCAKWASIEAAETIRARMAYEQPIIQYFQTVK